MINLQNLSKSYGDHKVLDKLNLDISKAGIHAILGKNGAGKTTLFKIISNLEDIDSGSINIQKNSVGYLPTELFFYPRILGREYLEFCLHAAKLPVSNYAYYNNIFNLPLNKEVSQYSSGMKKKLGIMGLLLQKKSFLILDEPYNGLDIESTLLLNKILIKLVESSKTILISSHILSSITDITSNIHYLKEGALIDYSQRDISELRNELLDVDKLNLLDQIEF